MAATPLGRLRARKPQRVINYAPMSKVFAQHANAGDFHLETHYVNEHWEWTVSNLRTGSEAHGVGKSLEDAKASAESVAGAKPKQWHPMGRPITGEPKDNPRQHAEHERLAEQSERWRAIQKRASKELLVEMLDTSMDGLQARFITGDSNAREEILHELEARI